MGSSCWTAGLKSHEIVLQFVHFTSLSNASYHPILNLIGSGIDFFSTVAQKTQIIALIVQFICASLVLSIIPDG